MKREALDVQEALRRSSALPFGWVCTLSKVTLGPAPTQLPLDELVEARLFNSRSEIRLFWQEGKLSAAELTIEPDDMVIEQTCAIENTKLFGNTLTVRKVLDTDEDGQSYVAATLLAGWEGGTGNV